MIRSSTLVLPFLLAFVPLTANAANTSPPEIQPSTLWPLMMVLILAALAGGGYWFYQQYFVREPVSKGEDPFCEHKITHTFISALPSLTRELNLEVAKSWQMEVLEKSDTKHVLGLNCGTNTVQIKCPVTYRYHLRLQDAWTLHIRGQAVLVQAPFIRPSQPPAIHTDGMSIESKRGWARLPPNDMVDQLHHDVTPILSRYAEDPHRLQFVRETARQSVAEFVRLWLEREDRWGRRKFTSIHVQFRDEHRLPDAPTVQLLPSGE